MEREKPLVFILWGKNAIEKKKYIDSRHLVLTSVHPSPLSAYREDFLDQNHFLKQMLFNKNGMTPIDWRIQMFKTVGEAIHFIESQRAKRSFEDFQR